MSSRKVWRMLQSASCVRLKQKPNAGPKVTTGRRLLVPLQTAQHVRVRRILSEIYICICTFTCCFLYEIGLKSFSLCVNTGSTPNAPSSSGLSAGVSSSGQPSAAMPGLTSPGAGQSFCFCVRPFFFVFSLLLVVCSCTGTVENKLNSCGVLT